jgi:hypothetical protein
MVSVNLRKFGKTIKNANYIHNYIQIAFRKWLFRHFQERPLAVRAWLVFFSLLMMGASLLFPIRRSRNQKTQSKQVRLSQTGCIDYPQNSIQPVCFHILLFIIKYDWDG